jgi:large subunit ribosomal protein L25
MVVSVAAPMTDAKLESLLASGAVAPEGGKEPEVAAKGKVEGAEGGDAAKAGAAAAAPDAKGGDKKGASAPKAEKKETEKKK